MHPFFTPWKHQKVFNRKLNNRKVFWCFQGVQKGCIDNKSVNEKLKSKTPFIFQILNTLNSICWLTGENCTFPLTFPRYISTFSGTGFISRRCWKCKMKQGKPSLILEGEKWLLWQNLRKITQSFDISWIVKFPIFTQSTMESPEQCQKSVQS